MDIMIDCETWGLAPGAVIRSVALVAFDPNGTDVATAHGPPTAAAVNQTPLCTP